MTLKLFKILSNLIILLGITFRLHTNSLSLEGFKFILFLLFFLLFLFFIFILHFITLTLILLIIHIHRFFDGSFHILLVTTPNVQLVILIFNVLCMELLYFFFCEPFLKFLCLAKKFFWAIRILASHYKNIITRFFDWHQKGA